MQKKVVDKLVDECDENIDEEVEIIDNNNKSKCNPQCTLYCFQYFL